VTFDPVHDLQAAFRGLLEAFSFPGRLVDLAHLAERMAARVSDPSVNPSLALGAAALLDQDAPYATAGTPGLAAFLHEWCAAGPVTPADARFLVVGESGTGGSSLAQLLAEVPVGTLTDPHLGASVLVGVEDLDRGTAWTLSGPGLKVPTVCVLPEGEAWVAARNLRSAEFPLGIDLAFFDRRGRVLALPRTTRLTAGKGA